MKEKNKALELLQDEETDQHRLARYIRAEYKSIPGGGGLCINIWSCDLIPLLVVLDP